MEIVANDVNVQLIGEPLAVGDPLPHFKVFNADNSKVKMAELTGRPLVISVVPDLNTPVCSAQTRKFNLEADQHSDIRFITISKNTPAEQADWCAAEGVKNLTVLSDEEESFGYATKLLIPDLDVLARAVYIMDAQGTVVYRQIVANIGDEPDYAGAIAALAQFQQ
ncbi:thiol peroxidase [Furfurilactobacillus curtus]|uniref:2-Cys peroxiredoxin n=1 Tax=Furfurilactobacillus curtus TaxID=1746200 RepID=A0ABQ5JPJ3_9LACO